MATLLSDIRYALRGFRRAPTFTTIAVLTLALGIGANTTIFTVVNAVLLEPLPYRQPQSLVTVGNMFSSVPEFLRLRERTRSFSEVSAYQPGVDLALSGDGNPVRITASSVSADLFTTLGAGAQVGRTFLPGDNHTGHDRIVVLSHDFWLERFGGDPQVLGRSIRVDGISRTIVGVMPAGFHFPSARVKVWYPMNLDPGPDLSTYWGVGGWAYVARLRPGVSVARALADTRSVAHSMLPDFPWRMPDAWGDSASVIPLRQDMTGPAHTMLVLLSAAVALVLLVACVNVANLVLARAVAREREMAIRKAVGGSWMRLARQLLTESIMLSVLGGIAGLVLAVLGIRVFVALLPADTPRLADVHLDARVLAITVALIGMTGIGFGLAPLARLTRAARTGRYAVGQWLVVAQIAMAVVLVVGAGLLGKSFLALERVDPGFVSSELVTATMVLPITVRDSAVHANTAVRAILDHVRQVPGVTSAAVATTLPLSGQTFETVIQTEAHPLPEGAPKPVVDWDVVTTDYFRTLGIPLREGREFTDADRTDALPVVIVDEVAARKFWPGQDPIGQRVRHSWEHDWMTVVGVVGSVRHDSLNLAPKPTFYRAFEQHTAVEADEQLALAIKSSRDPGPLVPSLRAAVTSADPNVPLSDIAAARTMISLTESRPRTTTLLLGAFAVAALLLGAIGVYGVMSHAVAQRTRDIGIRMALGAGTERVLSMTVRQGLVLVWGGVVIGLAAALGATRVLRAMLFGVSPTDPLLFGSVPILFGIVAIIASLGPARRAARVNPIIAIKSD